MATVKIPGGWSEPKPATPQIQGYADEVKPQVERKIGRNLETYKAVLYAEQVVAGRNYLIKIDTGGPGTSYVHVLLFVTLQNVVEFRDAWDGLGKDSPLEPPKQTTT
ncbi:cystatin-A5-like [Acanthaster planci]|uniref:Cystatin-A5-like n=1 Tax=Acanthaster planci TaxID=133434 RepID=A0A8B7XRT1_ACAPL|nr:cystatin-A5-like [Acanthaster planci]